MRHAINIRRDRIEADEHHVYVDVDIPGFYARAGSQTLVYHTYDLALIPGDRVLICGGVAEGKFGTVVETGVEPPHARSYIAHDDSAEPIYSYRCEAAPKPDPLLLSEIDALRQSVVDGDDAIARSRAACIAAALR